jgi:hypothetical protein
MEAGTVIIDLRFVNLPEPEPKGNVFRASEAEERAIREIKALGQEARRRY